MAQICSSQCCVFRANSRKSQKRQTQLQSRQDNSKAEAPWAMPICRKLDGWMLPGKGEAERGLAFGLTALSLLPSACKGNSKLALMSLARLFPQGRRGKASLHSDSTSLGVIVFAMLLRHFKERGLGFFL